MEESLARAMADALGGEAWQSGGGVWVVSVHRDSAAPAYGPAIVVFSGDAVCEYADDDALDAGRPTSIIHLTPRAR